MQSVHTVNKKYVRFLIQRSSDKHILVVRGKSDRGDSVIKLPNYSTMGIPNTKEGWDNYLKDVFEMKDCVSKSVSTEVLKRTSIDRNNFKALPVTECTDIDYRYIAWNKEITFHPFGNIRECCWTNYRELKYFNDNPLIGKCVLTGFRVLRERHYVD